MTCSMQNAKTVIEYVLDLSFLLLPLTYDRRKEKDRKNSQFVKYLTLSIVMYSSGHKYMNTWHLSFWFALHNISHSENGEGAE